MSISVVQLPPAPARTGRGPRDLVADAAESLARAGRTAVDSVDDEGLGETIAGLARLESQAAPLRLSLSAEADRRRVAEQTAETGPMRGWRG